MITFKLSNCKCMQLGKEEMRRREKRGRDGGRGKGILLRDPNYHSNHMSVLGEINFLLPQQDSVQ